MNFVKFDTSYTTAFPVANSTSGGQLLTESNQLSRETVANHSIIEYPCGPSYTHSLRDFEISGYIAPPQSQSTLYISGGIAIVHGHFFHYSENASISIDLSGTELSGDLCVGLRAMYDNENTLAASMKSDDQGFFEGIQVVILPKAEFLLPEDVPTSPESVTAHLKLGEFTFSNNIISNVVPNNQRSTVLDGERISNIDELISTTYAKKTGLDPKKLYVLPGRQSSGEETNWTDATGSLVVWDSNPQVRSANEPVNPIWLKDANISGSDIVDEAVVRYDSSDDRTKLVLPHKQIAGMTDEDNVSAYYEPVEVPFPIANRATKAGGVLDSNWVNFLNGLDNKIATMYRMPGGKMRAFIEILTSKDQLPEPPVAYYTEQTRSASYYDNRFQYSFNLLQTQVAQLNNKFVDFESKLESEWKSSVSTEVTTNLSSQNNSMQAQLDSFQQMLSSFQGDISSILNSIQQSNADLQGHIEAYRSLVDRVTRLEGANPSLPSYATIEAEISAINSRVTELGSSIDSVSSSIGSSINTLYQSLYGSSKSGDTGDIPDANAAIQQLRSQYDYLYDAIHDLYAGVESIVNQVSESAYNNLLKELRKTVEDNIATLAEQYNVSAEWKPGDYVLVAQDQTVVSGVSTENSYPSTMYVVVPGMTPLDSKYVASYYDVYTTDLSTPINSTTGSSNISITNEYNNAIDTYTNAVATLKRQVPSRFVYGYELGTNDVTELSSEDQLPDVYNSEVMLDELYNSSVLIEGVRGVPGKDYFVLRYRYPLAGSESTGVGYLDQMTGQYYPDIQYQVFRWVSVFFTLNLVSNKLEIDTTNPVILSGSTPYAENERVGGFLNVDPSVLGGGYVSRDEAGHLRLNDFELLAAGTSAYQLGEDRTEGAGLDITELQEIFDQYINQRIAWPNSSQLYKATQNNLRTDVITINLNIGSTSEGVLNIFDLDSRFNTAVHLKISGSSTENVVLNISNCQRLRITLDQTSHPTILLKNVCLYYDADVIDRISSIEGLTLWYDVWEDTDPPLEIDGMTVIYQGQMEPKGTHDYWTQASSNDNSYAYGLRQLTFASDGSIIGLGVAITDNTTSNVIPVGEAVFASTFTLPQSIGLSYPVTKMNKQLKVTGDFLTAYLSSNGGVSGYFIKKTTFTILTQKYIRYSTVKEFIQGVISFYTNTSFVPDAAGVDTSTLIAYSSEKAIDGWGAGDYHIFYGGSVE